ncbi:S-methyl-5-thioribose-1-phosphate isomerase [SAR202 cluster bacterium AC-409-J13_OGT_754m]|nr:S-methyl-5-thioribose-1-phosphate isomerase [SAR202 cluster bacterium AC-409-J13_OGT_754m]
MRPIQWSDNSLYLLDQTLLPHSETMIQLKTWPETVDAIKDMRVRGAPALGVTAGYAMALAAMELNQCKEGFQQFISKLTEISAKIHAARPTAVNIRWAITRQLQVANKCKDELEASNELLKEAQKMEREDVEINRCIGEHGRNLISYGNILTHCNTGALATAGYGTALGVVRASWENGNKIHVFHTETRPFLQGARLTAWELARLGIPSTMIVDGAAGLFMNEKTIQHVIVGADRIAANGDTANKIGTYSLAVLANENSIPFYVAAPISTIDLTIATGGGIPIEERPADEVTHLGEIRTAAPDTKVRNPSFDITPARYITAFITENGVIRQPFETTIPATI